MLDQISALIICEVLAASNSLCLLIASRILVYHGYANQSKKLAILSLVMFSAGLILAIAASFIKQEQPAAVVMNGGIFLLIALGSVNSFLPSAIAHSRGLSNLRSIRLVNLVGLLVPPIWFFALSASLNDSIFVPADGGTLTDPVQYIPELAPLRLALHQKIIHLIETFQNEGAMSLADRLRREEAGIYKGTDALPAIKKHIQFAFLDREWPDSVLAEMRDLVESIEEFESNY